MDEQILTAAAMVDLSLVGMFWHATLTVKLVMLVLIICSIWSWGVIFDKLVSLRLARRELRRFERAFWSGEPLDDLAEKLGPAPRGRSARIFMAGILEWQESHRADGGLIPHAQARIDKAMDVAIMRQSASLERGLPILATIGSAAPFVGLFGTVFGIMNAFMEIAAEQNTSLVVVAPGIAEALLATGLGLMAAIPAVVFYNKFSADTDRLVSGYEGFADEFSAILSRQLEG